jgi:hypothetical protein
VLPSIKSAPDFAELLVDTAADPHFGQVCPGELLFVPSQGTNWVGGISSAVASARMVRSEDRAFSVLDV